MLNLMIVKNFKGKFFLFFSKSYDQPIFKHDINPELLLRGSSPNPRISLFYDPIIKKQFKYNFNLFRPVKLRK
jgi:hypothetical protein